MEALASLSLAGTIVQFVDFGLKLVKEGQEMYKSTTGILTVNEEIELATTDLRVLVDKLEQSFTGKFSDLSSCYTKEDHDYLQYFQIICKKCIKIAEELIAKLEKLKRRESTHRGWESFRQVIRGAWSKNEIASLSARLLDLRRALETRVLFSIRENLDAATLCSSERFDALDEQTQRIIVAMLDDNAAMSSEITLALAQLVSRLEAVNEEQHRQTREMIVERLQHRAIPGDIVELTARIEMLSVSPTEENQLRNSIQTTILEGLKYPTMTNRYEDVVDAHPETFEWAFHDSDAVFVPWDNFPRWLKTGNGIYWVNGKAGSGKSTLMKHIFDDHRTHNYLLQWAEQGPGNEPLCIATFYFWNSGTAEQKSQIGLLRALLFQVLDQFPDLVPIVFPTIWARKYSRALKDLPLVWSESWSLRQLSAALKFLLQQTTFPLKICLLIDGLDEFGGDHDDIAEIFKNAVDVNSSYLKICVSSRPWVVFEDNFRHCPSLRLQDLTHNDIVQYVTDRFHNNMAFKRLEVKSPEEGRKLIHEIVDKASGVFLWVRIVVKSLLDGIRNMDTISDLWMRLRMLPTELEPLYHHLMSRIEPLYLDWASKTFQILRTSQELSSEPFGEPLSLDAGSASGVRPLSILALYLALNPEIEVEKCPGVATQAELNARCQETQIQLTARCAGLLEVSLLRGQEERWQKAIVQYLHRTVRDFLEADVQWSGVLAYNATWNFDPSLSMMKSSVQCLRIYFRKYSGKSNLDRDMRVINALATDVMVYAFHADAKAINQEAEFAILDELEDLMLLHASPLHSGIIKHWSQRLVPKIKSLEPQIEFLSLATVYCLANYITKKLNERPSLEAQRAAFDLLRYLNSNPKPGILHCTFPSPTPAVDFGLRSLSNSTNAPGIISP